MTSLIPELPMPIDSEEEKAPFQIVEQFESKVEVLKSAQIDLSQVENELQIKEEENVITLEDHIKEINGVEKIDV